MINLEKIFFSLISVTLLTLNLNGSDLDSLLEDFATENDLSKQTKAKDTGTSITIVYTRKDLDNLQYQTLKDILTMQRFFPYAENRFGEADLLSSNPLHYGKAGQLVKIFIDNHELTLPYLGSGISLFGDIELDFIDHIEVYEGAASYEHVREPAILTIKLYSKTPDRDNGHAIGGNIDNYGTHKSFFQSASNDKLVKYFIHLSNQKGEREDIVNETTLNRYIQNQHLYSTFQYDEHKFVLQYLKKEKNEFMTTDDNIENEFLHIGYSKEFMDDKSVELKASYNKNKSKYNFTQTTPFVAMPNSNPIINPPYDYVYIYGQEHDKVETVTNISLLKKIDLENHKIITGIYAKQNKIDMKSDELISSFVSSTDSAPSIAVNIPVTNKLEKQNYYSVYFQDKYIINSYHNIMGSVKIDKEINSNIDNNTLKHYNLSHTYKNDTYQADTFYSSMELNFVPYVIDKAIDGIEKEELEIYGHYSKYKSDNYDISYNVLVTKIYKGMLPDTTTGKIVNVDSPLRIFANSIKLNYYYNKNDSVMIEPWRNDDKYKSDTSYTNGLSIKAINIFSKFVVLNEYRYIKSKDDKSKDGWQYNLSVKYKYSKDLFLYLKGENIFDSLNGTYYLNYQNNTVGIPAVEPRASIGIKYTF